MKKNFYKLFKNKKPIIAMVHFPALPGSPLYDEKGLDFIYKSIEKDLINLQKAEWMQSCLEMKMIVHTN